MRDRAVIFVLASTLLLGCVGCSAPKGAVPSEPSPTAEATVSPLPSPSPTPEPTPTPESFSSLESAPISDLEPVSKEIPTEERIPSDISIDLSDPSMYRKINIFLSNFSECRFPTFSVDDPDCGKIADFAFMHAWLNSPSVVEDYSNYFPVNDDYDLVASCVSVTYIEKVAQHFFAGEVDTAGIEAAWKNGHGQGSITNGVFGLGFSLADSITDLGENRFEIQFHTYTVPYSDAPTYDCSATSDIYSARPDNLPQPLYGQGAQFVGTPGSAIIEAMRQEDGSLSFYLCTYSIPEEY